MKLLIFLALLTSSLFSQTIMCYKKDLASETINNSIKLDGSRCNGKNSIKDMQSHGWQLKDSKITQNDSSSYNHMYIFYKPERKISYIYNNDSKKSYFDTKNKELKIYNTTLTTANIDMGNLIVGQSGMILNTDNPSDILISYATVTSTDESKSTITFSDKEILKQDGLPTSTLKPKDGDIFILNHLYNTSLLITPNAKASRMVKKIFSKQNFLSEDFFAAFLKLESQPVPSKKIIKDFCAKHEIGTLFIVIKNGVFIVDTTSFSVLKSFKLPINDSTTTTPFYTNISEIEPGIFANLKKSFNNFVENQELKWVKEEISSYNKHYSNILELY